MEFGSRRLSQNASLRADFRKQNLRFRVPRTKDLKPCVRGHGINPFPSSDCPIQCRHMSDVTRILNDFKNGDAQVSEELFTVVYAELRKLAAMKMAGENPGQTLQATALVHEVWLRLGADHQPQWRNRAQFFAAAGEAMRRILVEAARRKGRQKHGGQFSFQPLDDAVLNVPLAAPDEEILSVNAALERLVAEDADAARIVNMRYFVGLPLPEVAEILQISPRTADRLWAFARARLQQLIRDESE